MGFYKTCMAGKNPIFDLFENANLNIYRLRSDSVGWDLS